MWYHAKHVSYTVQFLNPQPKLAWDACNRNSVCQGTGVMTKHHHHLSRSKWYLPPVFCDNTMTAWWDTRCVPSRYNYTLHILHESIGYNSQYDVLHSQFRWEKWHLYIIASMRSTNTFRLPIGLKCSPDSANAMLENILLGSDATDVCVDDAGVFSSS
jgi:hypothetical protein